MIQNVILVKNPKTKKNQKMVERRTKSTINQPPYRRCPVLSCNLRPPTITPNKISSSITTL